MVAWEASRMPSSAGKKKKSANSVVAFEDDLFAVPAIIGELLAHAGDHVVQSADVGVDVKAQLDWRDGGIDRRQRKADAEAGGSLLNDAGDMLLHIAAEARPVFIGAAERGDVMEVGLAS